MERRQALEGNEGDCWQLIEEGCVVVGGGGFMSCPVIVTISAITKALNSIRCHTPICWAGGRTRTEPAHRCQFPQISDPNTKFDLLGKLLLY